MTSSTKKTSPPPSGWSKTLVVFLLLIVAALVFSYLAAFAVTGALVNADLVDKWPPRGDPRPRWMAIVFCSLSGTFLLIGTITKIASWRQIKTMDAMAEAEG